MNTLKSVQLFASFTSIFVLILVSSGDCVDSTTTPPPSSTTTPSPSTTTRPPKPDSAGILMDDWYKYSKLIFHTNKVATNRLRKLYGSPCVYQDFRDFSPVAAMAFPEKGINDTEKSTEVLNRKVCLREVARYKVASDRFIILPLPPPFCKLTTLDFRNQTVGKLYKRICYEDGYELLECDKKSQKCVCPFSGELKKLRMEKMLVINDKLAVKRRKPEPKCVTLDCGYCYTNSKIACANLGLCRESGLIRKWPLTHLNGSCRESTLQLNYKASSSPLWQGRDFKRVLTLTLQLVCFLLVNKVISE